MSDTTSADSEQPSSSSSRQPRLPPSAALHHHHLHSPWHHRRMEQHEGLPIAVLPVEVLERITELLPASTRRRDCLSLLRVSKLWYGPAIRELFSFVVLDSEDHAEGVLHTLQQNAAQNGALHTVVRKLSLLVAPAEEPDEEPPTEQPPQGGTATATAAAAAATAQGAPFAHFVLHHDTPVNAAHQPNLLHAPTTALPLAPPADIPAHPAADEENEDTPAPTQDEAPQPLDGDEGDVGAEETNLKWTTALEVLRRTICLQSLTVTLPRSQRLCEESMAALTRLRLLRKLDITAAVTFAQLWDILEASPMLQEVEIVGMKPTPTDTVPIFAKRVESTFHLTSLSIVSADLRDGQLLALCTATQATLRSLRISQTRGLTRQGYKAALGKVGGQLRRLSLQRVTFTPFPATDATFIHLLDDLPRVCPMLEELQIATDKVVSEERFLKVVLPSLFLTQLELDYKLPLVSEACLMEMIRNLPAGRMETLCLGKNLAHLGTPRVLRASSEIGIVVLGASV